MNRMTKDLENAASANLKAQPGQSLSDRALEEAALAGTAAMQRIIAERDSLRSRATARERELSTLRDTNAGFCRDIALIRDDYVKLATEFLTQLEHIDCTIREAIEKGHAANGESLDPDLVSLAKRFSPPSGRPEYAAEG
jgi:hypothetical protein